MKYPYTITLFSLLATTWVLIGCALSPATPTTPPTPTATSIPPTPTPGPGVPITIGDWEITLTEAVSTTEWMNSSTKEGFVLIMTKITVHNLNPEEAISFATEEAELLLADGTSIPSEGVIIEEDGFIETMNGVDMTGSGILGTSCIGCVPVFASTQDTIRFKLVFGATDEEASQPLTFQYQEWHIPFQLN